MSEYSYLTRNKNVQSLGHADYDAYLRSAAWQAIRSVVLRRAGHLCFCCGEKASQVHHMHYSLGALVGAEFSALVAVCGTCHKDAEFYRFESYKRAPLEVARYTVMARDTCMAREVKQEIARLNGPDPLPARRGT